MSSPSAASSSGDISGNSSAAGWIGRVSRQDCACGAVLSVAVSVAGGQFRHKCSSRTRKDLCRGPGLNSPAGATKVPAVCCCLPVQSAIARCRRPRDRGGEGSGSVGGFAVSHRGKVGVHTLSSPPSYSLSGVGKRPALTSLCVCWREYGQPFLVFRSRKVSFRPIDASIFKATTTCRIEAHDQSCCWFSKWFSCSKCRLFLSRSPGDL